MLKIYFLKAVTLIEVLITIVLLVIVIHFVSPAIGKLQDSVKLKSELTQFRDFIYQVQEKARYSKKSYTLSLSQDLKNNRWCVIALKKKGRRRVKCNCLELSSCSSFKEYTLYQNHIKDSQIRTPLVYPKRFIDINGMTAKLESQCLKIKVNKQEAILQFKPYGIIDVISKNKKTKCRAY